MSFFKVFREVLRGKSVSRTLSNLLLSRYSVVGPALDVGGHRAESHYRFLGMEPGADIKTLNVSREHAPDYLTDLETSDILAEEASFRTVLCFNLLEHLEHYEHAVAEMRRVLAPGGRLIGSVPFLVNVHPDPYDFQRFTGEKLERMFLGLGFREVEILPASFGPFVAAYAQTEMFLPRIWKPFAFVCAYLKDAFLLRFFGRRYPFRDRFVLAYVFSCTK